MVGGAQMGVGLVCVVVGGPVAGRLLGGGVGAGRRSGARVGWRSAWSLVAAGCCCVAAFAPVGCGRLHGGGRTWWAFAEGRLGVSGLPGSTVEVGVVPTGAGDEDRAPRPVLGP